ncbi:hypothetical protein AALI21_13070 [Corynebacteriaceae bacterium 6-324]
MPKPLAGDDVSGQPLFFDETGKRSFSMSLGYKVLLASRHEKELVGR